MLPTGRGNRLAVVGCYLCLILSKVCGLAGPAYLGRAVNLLAAGENPIAEIVIFSLLRFAVSCFDEMQRYVYLRVKETAYVETATQVFSHLVSGTMQGAQRTDQ